MFELMNKNEYIKMSFRKEEYLNIKDVVTLFSWYSYKETIQNRFVFEIFYFGQKFTFSHLTNGSLPF